jgi:hypothetical protein
VQRYENLGRWVRRGKKMNQNEYGDILKISI